MSDNDLSAFLRVRGDAILATLQAARENLAAQVEAIDVVLVTIKKLDDNIGLAGEPKANLIGLMRDLYPQHNDKTDEELLRLVGGMGQ